MDIGHFLEESWNKNRFLITDAALSVTGAVLSGCFLRRWITVLSPKNGAIYMLAQTVTAHCVNRLLDGDRDLAKTGKFKQIFGNICGLVAAGKVVTPYAGWTFASSFVISLLIKEVLE